MISSFRLSCLLGALLCSQFAQAQVRPPTYGPQRADVVAAAAGRPLATVRMDAPERGVAELLRARGRQDATLTLVDTRAGRAGTRHLRFEQTVDGLQVYGAYAKAAVDRPAAWCN